MIEFSNVPIDFDDIPHAEHVQLKAVDKMYLIGKVAESILFYVVIVLIFLSIHFFSEELSEKIQPYFYYFLSGIILLALLTIVLDYFGYYVKGYAVREKDIIFRTGLIYRKKIHVPFNRVQHAEVNQGVVDRYLDLAKLKIYTAGGSKSDLSIPGLKNQDALNLKSFILKKTEEDESI